MRTRSWRVLWCVPVILGIASWSLAQEPKPAPKPAEPPKAAQAPAVQPPKAEKKDLFSVIKAQPNLKTFAKLLDQAGLAQELAKGPYTVFAPTDEAFLKMPKEQLDKLMKPDSKAELVKILNKHIVKGKMPSADVVKAKELETLDGKVPVTTEEGDVLIGTAKVVKPDIAAENGVIHVVAGLVKA